MDDDKKRTDMHLFVGLTLGGCVTFAVAIAIGGALDVKPGSLADWVAGVSTFAALLAASYAAIQTARTFRLEQKRDDERDRRDRQRQAELVAVWAGRMSWIGPLHTHTFAPGKPEEHSIGPGVVYPERLPVTIRNASPMPIFNLTVDVYVGQPTEEDVVLGAERLIADDKYGRAVIGDTEDYDIVTPEFTEDIIGVLEKLPSARHEPARLVIGWTFRDNAGLWWRKVPNERLRQIDRPERFEPKRPQPTART